MGRVSRYCLIGFGGVVLLVITWVALTVVAYSLEHRRKFESAENIRAMIRGMAAISHEDGDAVPASAEGWRAALVAGGHVDDGALANPWGRTDDGHGYVIIPGADLNSFDPCVVVVYEPPSLKKKDVLVGYADSHVDLVPMDVFMAHLEEGRLNMVAAHNSTYRDCLHHEPDAADD